MFYLYTSQEAAKGIISIAKIVSQFLALHLAGLIKDDVCHRGRRRRHPVDFISVVSTKGFRKSPATSRRARNALRNLKNLFSTGRHPRLHLIFTRGLHQPRGEASAHYYRPLA